MELQKLDWNKKTVLVTGAAGFIGSNLVLRLLCDYPECQVVGVDNLNDYYEVSLKEYRLEEIRKVDTEKHFTFYRQDLSDRAGMEQVFQIEKPDAVVNLAAQAGVRYSIENPDVYIQSNLIGFYNVLELCRHYPVAHLVYASSSSVYGDNEKIPFSTDDMTDRPVSLYGATKKCNELLAYSYAKLYGIPCTGLRFFTVYGPAGRPDMAYFGFTKKLLAGKTIEIFNYGNCKRDFTYVDDIVTGVVNVLCRPPKAQKEGEKTIAPAAVYNIGNSRPENLLDFVQILQEELVGAGLLPADYDFDAHRKLLPMQPGDVPATFADVSALERDFGFKPSTPLREGLHKFVLWYRDYYGGTNQ